MCARGIAPLPPRFQSDLFCPKRHAAPAGRLIHTKHTPSQESNTCSREPTLALHSLRAHWKYADPFWQITVSSLSVCLCLSVCLSLSIFLFLSPFPSSSSSLSSPSFPPSPISLSASSSSSSSPPLSLSLSVKEIFC